MKRALLIACAAACMVALCTSKKTPENAAIRLNDEWITHDEINSVAQLLRQQAARFSPKAALEGLDKGIRKNAARQLIADRLMLQEAKRRKIAFSQQRTDSLFERYKKRAGGEAAFTSMLTRSGKSADEFKLQMAESMLVDSLVRQVLSEIDTVDLAQCKEFYDNNVERFRQREKVRTSQILFTVAKDMGPEKKSAVRKKANDVLAQANAGKDFAALAKAHSQGPNAKTGGDIGWFERGDMKPQIDAAIFSLGKDQISSVIESDIGFHIFKKTGEKMSEPKRFHEVAQSIKTTLELKSKNDAVMKVVDDLMAAAAIEYIDTTLAPPGK